MFCNNNNVYKNSKKILFLHKNIYKKYIEHHKHQLVFKIALKLTTRMISNFLVICTRDFIIYFLKFKRKKRVNVQTKVENVNMFKNIK